VVDHYVVFGALMGAIVWNALTWWYGIPSSSSHALIGGIVGAVMAKSGAGSPALGRLRFANALIRHSRSAAAATNPITSHFIRKISFSAVRDRRKERECRNQ